MIWFDSILVIKSKNRTSSIFPKGIKKTQKDQFSLFWINLQLFFKLVQFFCQRSVRFEYP